MLLVSHPIKHSRLYVGLILAVTLCGIMIFPIRRIAADSPLEINTAPSPVASTSDNPEDLDEAQNMFSNSAITFEINRGQTDARVKFLARGGGSRFFFTPEEVVTVLHRPDKRSKFDRDSRSNRKSRTQVVRMRLSGARKGAEIIGELETQAHANYFIGKDREKWVTDVPTFAQVRYKEAYPGIDVVYHGNQKQLQYDFELAPGASPDQLAINFGGVKKIKVNDDGSLQLQTPSGEFQQKAPFAFQDVDGRRVVVDCDYVVRRDEVGFQLGPYDRTRKLIIDPTLIFSTYLGGSGEDRAHDITIDGSRSVYVTGETVSTDFPVGAFPIGTYSGGTCMSGSYPCFDVFVTKLTPGGGSILYSTYLGGVKDDVGKGIAVDALRRAYVVGETSSSDFPIPMAQGAGGPGVYKAMKKGASDAFMVKLSTLGNELVYSTFINGHGSGTLSASGEAVAIDILGHVWIAGSTTSIDFPTGSLFGVPLRSSFCKFGAQQGFLIKINPDPVCQDQQDPKCAVVATEPTDPPDFIYGSYVCGSNSSSMILDMALDSVGNVWLTGEARGGYPTTLDAFQPVGTNPSDPNQRDAIVTKIDMTGTFMFYSSYIGGSGTDIGWSIATDTQGNAYVAGSTASSNFPITPGAVDSSYGGLGEAFVVKFLSSGMPAYSTFVGGANNMDSAAGIAVDDAGNAYITGNTASTNFPVTPNATQPTHAGGGQGDSFLTKLNPDGSAYLFSTYLGGSGSDFGNTVCVDKAGNAYIAGRTSSTNFPTVNAFDSTFGGGQLAWDGFVTKLSTEMFVISGRVTDSNNLGFNGVTVTLSGSRSATTTTDVSGNYSFEVTPNGNYTVTPSRSGFTFNVPNISYSNLNEDKGAYFIANAPQPVSNVITAPNLGDALVQDNGAASTMNYGSAPELLDQVKATVGMNRESYLKFDVSNFSTATSVKLKLFGRLSSSQDTNIGASIYSVADTTWDEAAITWNTRPAAGSSALDSETVTNTTAQWYEWDVTSYVNAQRAAGAKVVSFVIKNDTTSITVTRFNSREAGENMPRLEVAAPVAGPLPSPWVQAEVPSTLTPVGAAEHDSGIYTVSGYGAGIPAGASADEFHSVHQPMSGNFKIIARVLSMQSAGAQSRAGLQVRQSLAAGSMHATILLRPGESQLDFMSRGTAGNPNTAAPHWGAEWLMLHRNGTELRGYTSHDGVNWFEAGGPVTLSGLTDPVQVGMVVASGNTTDIARARFSDVTISTGTPNPPPQISIGFPLDGATYSPNTNIQFAAIATDPAGGTINTVEFLNGTTVLGTASTSVPTIYNFTWSNVPTGIYSITARATDNGGAVTTSVPITIAVDPTGAVSLNPTDDAYVRDGSPLANFGNDSLLKVWGSLPGSIFQTYIKFNTSSVSNVTKASLRLYNGTQGAAPNISVNAVSDINWAQGTITWDNKPIIGAQLRLSAGPLAVGPRFFEWDISDYVIAQKAGGTHTISLAIQGSITGGQVEFSSSETGLRPELLLTTSDYKGRASAQPFSEDALYPLIASYLQRYELPPWLDSLRPITTENSVVQFQRGRQATPAERKYVPEELLIQFEDRVSENAKVQARSRVGGVTKEKIKSAARRASEHGDAAGELELVKLPRGRDVMDAVRLLRNQPGVRFAEPNLIFKPQTTVNDTNYTNGSLWNMYGPSPASSPSNDYGINAEPVWDAGHTGDTTVYVGVVDTGVQVEHPDLRQNAWTNSLDLPGDGIDNDRNGFVDDTFGWDFANNDNSVYDDPVIDRHGTLVAGSLASVGGNSTGGVAASWRTTFIPAKVIHNDATLANAIKGIDYIVDLKIRHGINVVAINASLGHAAFFSQALLDAITRGAKSNILFIAGAGNGGSDQIPDDNDLVPFYPASHDTKAGAGYDAVISVAAIASNGALGPHSNYGPTSVDLGAPGISVLSTAPPSTYATDSGSSFAAPHVTGAVALYASMYRRASAAAIKEVILASARETPTSSLSGFTVTGGRLNVGFWGQ